MAVPTLNQRNTNGPGFKQQDASAWISFDPDLTGHRKDVRSAAAKSSAAARKATIARKLALDIDCTSSQAQATKGRVKKRRREQTDGSPISAASSSATLHSRRQSEISLASLASANSPMSSGTVSPCLMQAPQSFAPVSWEFGGSPLALAEQPSTHTEHVTLQRAVSFVLDVDSALTQDLGSKEPTHFGASRIKSRAISNIHDAIGARRAGSGTLLAVALLAAWDLRYGDERSSLMHLRAWHQLALPQNVLPRQDGFPPPNVTITEAIRLSLQCHLPPDAYNDMRYLFNNMPSQQRPMQAASGREIVSFFSIVGDLVEPTGAP